MKNVVQSRIGFTLIELLVAVLIIGILAAVALPQYQKAVDKSRAAEVLTMGKYLKNLEEAYYLEHGNYTDNFNKLGAETTACKIIADGTILSCTHFYYKLLLNFNRVTAHGGSGGITVTFVLDHDTTVKSDSCTAYKSDNYKYKPLCQSMTGDYSDGERECGGTCRYWVWQ